MRLLGCLAINRVSTIVSASIFVNNLRERKPIRPWVFLDSATLSCHHGTTMRIPLFHKRPKPPTLTGAQTTHRTQKIETLKAGRLASLALSFTSRIIESIGARLAGSESCRLAAAEIEKELASFCDTAEQSSFELESGVHSLPLKVAVILYPVLVLLQLIGLPYLSFMLFLLYGWYAGKELYLYKPLSIRFLKRDEGVNVHAVLQPKGPVEQTILFTSHHDSAPLYSYNRLDRLTYAKKVGLPVFLFLGSGLLSMVQILSELVSGLLLLPNVPSIASLILLLLFLFSTPLLLGLWNFHSETGSPGAGDNLVSVGMIIQLARYFHWKRSCNSPLSSTRLVFCSFDAEEMGLRGSREWYRKNRPDLDSALVLNFDCVYHSDQLTFLERDVNGHQMLDSSLARRCAEIAQSMGYPATCESIPRLSGGTDAAEASRAQLKACTLTSVGWDDRTKPSVYHTEDDTVDSIDPKAVEMALSVAIRLVELVDQKKLWEADLPKQEKQKEEESDPKLVFSKLTHR